MQCRWGQYDVKTCLVSIVFNYGTSGIMAERTLTLFIISSLVASISPLYTTLMTSGSFRCNAAIAVQSTRSPPPPALLIQLVENSKLRPHYDGPESHQYG